MTFPIQIQFRDIAESDFVYNDIFERAEKLGRYCDRIISCHVVVHAPNRRRHQGKFYQILVRLHLPGTDIVVCSKPTPSHEDIYVAIRDAFDSVRRQTEESVRRIRGEYKEHAPCLHGKVIKLFAAEGFGFVTTPDRREVYFHEHAVLNHRFRDLAIGDEVRFSEEMGEEGPQATSMTRVGRNGHLAV